MIKRIGQIVIGHEETIKYDYNYLMAFAPVMKLGIQAPMGTQFTLNNSDSIITLDQTGIYELDVESYGQITSLVFKDMPERHNRILIDFVYLDFEGGKIL